MKAVFSEGSLEYVGMNILGRTPNTKQSNQFVVLMIDGYLKLTMAILTTKSNTATVARIFIEHWVANYGIPSKLLTDNIPPFA